MLHLLCSVYNNSSELTLFVYETNLKQIYMDIYIIIYIMYHACRPRGQMCLILSSVSFQADVTGRCLVKVLDLLRHSAADGAITRLIVLDTCS